MSEDTVFNALESVSDEASFVSFVEALAIERRSTEGVPETVEGFRGAWANQSIEQFLEAAVAWAKDSQFGERPGPKPENPWKLFALFLWAGRSYE